MDKNRDETWRAPADDLAVREQMLDNRVAWLNAHDAAVAKRESAITEREELVGLREAQVEARREVEAARVERERLLVQIRKVNEGLVLAALHVQELADDAIAARATADDIAERFRALVLTTSALVWRATSEGRVELDCEAWRRLTGLPASQGEWDWLEAVHPSDRDRVRDTWNEAVATATPYACQHRLQNRKGNYAWVVARAVPIVKSDIVREWIGMMSDISDRVRVEEARDQFIGILGHDLRNPLASIVGGVELLHDLPEPFARNVARMARSAHRIEVIIRDLLDFARGRLGGGIPIAPRPSNLGVVCNDVVEECKQAHPNREIQFECIGDLSGEWDPDRIEQVISNLVGNAVVHGEDPIGVTSRSQGEHVVTTVHNRGEPIPAALLSTLFEPFTRGESLIGDSVSTRAGLGLGLYIAHEIVRAHGGKLSVSSSAEEGTTFTFAMSRSVPRRSRTTTGESLVVRSP